MVVRLNEHSLYEIVSDVLRTVYGKRFICESFRGEVGLSNSSNGEVAQNLAMAKNMQNSGECMEKIKLVTGWEIGYDGKWKYEGLDGDFRKVRKEEVHCLYDIWDDEELYSWYPSLKGIKITFDNNSPEYASYIPGCITIHDEIMYWLLPDEYKSKFPKGYLEKNSRSTLAHEIQHAIQDIEKWEGGMPVVDYNTVNTLLKEIDDKIRYVKGLRGSVTNVKELRTLYSETNNKTEKMCLAELMTYISQGYGIDDFVKDLQSDYERIKSADNSEYYSSNGEREAYTVGDRLLMPSDERRRSLMTRHR